MFLHSLHFVTVKVQSRCQTGSAKLTNIFPAALSPLSAFVSGFCGINMWPAHSSRNLCWLSYSTSLKPPCAAAPHIPSQMHNHSV